MILPRNRAHSCGSWVTKYAFQPAAPGFKEPRRCASAAGIADRQGAGNAAGPRQSGRKAASSAPSGRGRSSRWREIGRRRCAPRSHPSSPWRCCRGRAPSRPKGGSVVHMELGEPGAPAPRAAREAAKRAIDAGRIGYTPALGVSSLRERIARHYRDAYGLERRSGANSRHHRLLGGLHSRLPRLFRRLATGSPSRLRAIRPIATSSRRSASSRW